MKIRYCILIFVTAGLFFANTAYSQEIAVKDSVRYNTEEIKVISNRVVTDIFNSPSKVEVISRERMVNTNGETLADVLKLGSGIFIKSYGPGAGLNTISLNGMGAEHTLILLNGFKLNSFQNALLDLATFSKDEIERIEILNNGSSSLYGSEAMGGVVNIITKSPSVKDLGLKINLQGGSFNQKKFLFSASKKLSALHLTLDQSYERSDNDFNFYLTSAGKEILRYRTNANYEIKNYSARAEIFPDSFSSVSFYSVYSDVFRKLPGVVTLNSSVSASEQSDRNWLSILSFETRLKNNLKLSSHFNFQNNLMNYTDGGITNSFYKNHVYSSHITLENDLKNVKVNSGIESAYATIKSNELESNAERFQTGIFSAAEINITNRFKLFPSARFDHISDINKNVLTGKLGGNFKVLGNKSSSDRLHLRFGAGNNFAAPTFNALYWDSLGNKNLKPERSVNFDAGAVYGFNFLGSVILDLTYTKILAKDKIVWRPENNSIWRPVNIEKSESDVISASGEYTNDFGGIFLRLRQSYTYTSSIKKSMDMENDPSFNKQIFYIPVQSSKTEAEVRFKNLGLNFFYNFIGKRYTDFENRNYLPGVDIFDGNIFYRVKFGDVYLGMRFEVNNILNKNYSIIEGYPMPLRNYKLNLSFEY